MSSPSTFECFGLVIHGFGWPDIQHRIEDAIAHHQPTWIVTANPEILLYAKRDPAYWHILYQSDIRTVDGVGLQYAGWFLGSSPTRITGVELAEHLLKYGDQRGWSVALLGGQKGVTDQAIWNVRARYPQLRLYAEEGGVVDQKGIGDEFNEEALHRLTQVAPDLLFVALGHPKQEAWIARHLAELPNTKVVMGIGGTVDYWSGSVRRAPQLFQRLGIEWIWRLLIEPWRLKRILDAVCVFPVRVMLDRLPKLPYFL